MERAEYLKYSLDYFNGKISIVQLIHLLERKVDFSITGKELLPKERFILISNHPLSTPELHIPSTKIETLKGGNKYGYEVFHFSVVHHILFQRLIEHDFCTIVNDIGWNEVTRDLGFFVVEPTGTMRFKKVISQMTGSNKSIVIFPEGGSKEQTVFYPGFLYLALKLKIRYLVVTIMSPRPSLSKENFLKVLKVINLENISRISEEFIEEQRMTIVNALKYVNPVDIAA